MKLVSGKPSRRFFGPVVDVVSVTIVLPRPAHPVRGWGRPPRHALRRINLVEYRACRAASAVGGEPALGRPIFYAFGMGKLHFWPTPDSDYETQVRVYRKEEME